MTENTKTIDYWINLARQIAIEAHTGQFRNDKTTPYIKHPEEVAKGVEKRLQPIAWLHDTIEDSKGKVTEATLVEAGFPQYIIDAVVALTHIGSDTNMVYWQKIAKNADAVIVKLEDIRCNLSDKPSDYSREKYARAQKFFASQGFSV